MSGYETSEPLCVRVCIFTKGFPLQTIGLFQGNVTRKAHVFLTGCLINNPGSGLDGIPALMFLEIKLSQLVPGAAQSCLLQEPKGVGPPGAPRSAGSSV